MQHLPYVIGKLYPLNVEELLKDIKNSSFFVLLETARAIGDENKSYLFKDPISVIKLDNPSLLEEFENKINSAIKNGYYLAGWWCYELGYLFEKKLNRFLALKKTKLPLACLGVFKKPMVWNHVDTAKSFPWPNPDCSSYITGLHPCIDKKDYVLAIDKIKKYIVKGDTYQVNYTFKIFFKYLGDPIKLYLSLRAQQAVSYSALIKFDNIWCLSISPELFFRIEKNFIYSRPMKGTIKRGLSLKEDIKQAEFLRHDPKNRAENVMIVDLLRNDIGRLAKKGSINVPELFLVERYETLFQMTSKVQGTLSKNYSINEILRRLFPCGSVTGAPKIRTMEIIAELERVPREIYTGSVGFISPNKKAVLNVAIRTIVIDKKNNKADIGIGSGVTIDSNPDAEYDECLLKAHFLEKRRAEFSLIETILFLPKGFKKPFYTNALITWPIENQEEIILLEYHIKRLCESAHFFGFPFDRKKFLDLCYEIRHSVKNLPKIVRILLARDGRLSFSMRDFDIPKDIVTIKLSSKKVNTKDIFLYHKTTNRELFDKEFSKARSLGIYDFIFLNEKNEITQGTISNIILKIGNNFFTPPIKSGILNGCMREFLLKNKRIKEKNITLKDIHNADEIYISNSVRGVLKANFVK